MVNHSRDDTFIVNGPSSGMPTITIGRMYPQHTSTPAAAQTAFAFSMAFSAKVDPVSSTSTSMPASEGLTTSTPSPDKIAFISASFPGL